MPLSTLMAGGLDVKVVLPREDHLGDRSATIDFKRFGPAASSLQHGYAGTARAADAHRAAAANIPAGPEALHEMKFIH